MRIATASDRHYGVSGKIPTGYSKGMCLFIEDLANWKVTDSEKK